MVIRPFRFLPLGLAAVVLLGAGCTSDATPADTQTGATPVAAVPTPSPVTPSPVPSAKTWTLPPILPLAEIDKTRVTISTNKGDIVVEMDGKDAPQAVSNFVTLAKGGFYDGVIFHRVIKGFMIQGGDPTGTGRGGPGYQFKDEINPSSALYKTGYKRGVLAMANAGPNTNGSQFFIMHADYALPPLYVIFGHVVSGMEVVDAIATTPTDAGDRPVSDITMQKVTVQGAAK